MGPIAYTCLLAAAAVGTSALAIRAEDKHDNLYRDLKTLQDFAKTVTVNSDPNNTVANWLAFDPKKEGIEKICNLTGLVCAVTPEGFNAVAGVDLNGAGLGVDLHLDGLLDKLLDITFFHANTNQFIGTIPDVSASKYLYEIDVSNSGLTGPFPHTIFAAPLTFLDLRHNKLWGELPKNLFTDTDMDVIFLNNNLFTGPIPPTNDKEGPLYLSLANNFLTGPIPADLARNPNLLELELKGTLLEGNVPEEICGHKNISIIDVRDSPNLSGTLGPNCARLYHHKKLRIDGTKLEIN